MDARRLLQTPCVLLFNCALLAPLLAVASTDNGTLTAGQRAISASCVIGPLRIPYQGIGYDAGVDGLYSPSVLTGGKGVIELEDIVSGATCAVFDLFTVSGFLSNPGQSWLTSVTCNGITLNGSSASYSYTSISGQAQWSWNTKFGFSSGSNYSCTITHS